MGRRRIGLELNLRIRRAAGGFHRGEMQGRERARETWTRTLTRSLDVRFGGVRAADQDKYRDPWKEKSNQGRKPIRGTPDNDKEQREPAQNPSRQWVELGKGMGE